MYYYTIIFVILQEDGGGTAKRCQLTYFATRDRILENKRFRLHLLLVLCRSHPGVGAPGWQTPYRTHRQAHPSTTIIIAPLRGLPLYGRVIRLGKAMGFK
jgi:hypothetical protein